MSNDGGYEYLTAAEARFLDAALSRLVPADELGVGAKESGGTTFIDRQLAGAWGVHGRNYRMGPWREGTPQQGYQSPLTPQEVYRAAIRETNRQCEAQLGKPFHALDAQQQDEVLRALESDEMKLPSISARVFFEMLWQNVQEGFFADPLYGGNRDKAGWRLIGFPGIAAGDYSARMGDANVPYRVEPMSILDVQRGDALLDAQGFAKHIRLRETK
jgi:gluconate 2-dehydrogenase gamma chain